jgi:hypothetical protein
VRKLQCEFVSHTLPAARQLQPFAAIAANPQFEIEEESPLSVIISGVDEKFWQIQVVCLYG